MHERTHKHTRQPLSSLNSSRSHAGLISAPLSFADIYLAQFIVLYVKIIGESVLQHVDLREHLHRPLSFLPLLCLPVSPPNQNHIDPAFERSTPRADVRVEMN